MAKHRVISLIASSTEIVCALGLGDQLVGRSHECDYPEWVKRLPQCTEPKFNIEGSSVEIDQRVKAILQEGLSVYRVFAEKLQELQPDVIVTQVQCEVCAVSEKDVEAAVCELIETRPKIVSLNTNAPENGEKLVAELQGRMRAVEAKASGLKNKPRVAFVEWIEPLMSCGNWMPTLIEMAGGINLFGEAGKHSPWMTWEDLRAKDPDTIVISPCGYDIRKTREELPSLLAQPGWNELKAVKNGKVFLADGNQFFNRPGPRLVESLEMLAEIFHPEVFSFGHHGQGWEKLIP